MLYVTYLGGAIIRSSYKDLWIQEKVKERMGILWPSSICRSFPVVISKILMIPFMALLARNFPSGQYAILRMNFPLVSKEYSFFPLSTSKMLTFPTWIPWLDTGNREKRPKSMHPQVLHLQTLCLLFSNCQRIWASREWVAAMDRVWLKSTDNTLSWWLSRFRCRSSFLSHHFQTFTWSSRDPMTTVSESSLFDPQATDQMATSWVCSCLKRTLYWLAISLTKEEGLKARQLTSPPSCTALQLIWHQLCGTATPTLVSLDWSTLRGCSAIMYHISLEQKLGGRLSEEPLWVVNFRKINGNTQMI